jgi:hypothetical protein
MLHFDVIFSILSWYADVGFLLVKFPVSNSKFMPSESFVRSDTAAEVLPARSMTAFLTRLAFARGLRPEYMSET